MGADELLQETDELAKLGTTEHISAKTSKELSIKVSHAGRPEHAHWT